MGLSQMIAADQGKQYAAGITSTIVILLLAIDEAPNAQQLGLRRIGRCAAEPAHRHFAARGQPGIRPEPDEGDLPELARRLY